MELVWTALVLMAAVSGIVLAALWWRVRQRNQKDRDLDELARRVEAHKRRAGAPRARSRRTPAPAPDLVSVSEGWKYTAETDPDLAPLPGLGTQSDGTPTAPTGPRHGLQFRDLRHLLDQPTVTTDDTVTDDKVTTKP